MPSDFTYNNGPTPALKSNLYSVPVGANAEQYVQDQDINQLTAAVESLRAAIISGQYYGLLDNASAPVSAAGGLRLRSNNGRLEISENGEPYRDLQGIVNVRDYGAVGDGATDDSSAIQAAIDANKGSVILFPAGTYLHAGILLNGSSYNGTVLTGPGTLKLKADGGSQNVGMPAWVGILIQSCSGVIIEGLRFDGNRSAMTHTEFIHTIGVAGASALTLANLQISEIRGDGILVAGSAWPSTALTSNASDIRIVNVHVRNTADDGRNAITVVTCSGLMMHGFTSYQIGTGLNDGSGAGGIEPGGVDFEPDNQYDLIENVIVSGVRITSAGSSGFQFFGKSQTADDSARDWNIQRVHASNIQVTRTLYTSQANIFRCRDIFIDADLHRTTAYDGGAWAMDYCDRVQGRLGASHVTTGITIGATDEVRDCDIVVDISDFQLAGIRPTKVTRSRFRGRIANGSASGFGPFGVQYHNGGRLDSGMTRAVFAVDIPYDGVLVKAHRNESSNLVAMFTDSEIRDCDLSGYSAFNVMLDDATAPAWASSTAYAIGLTVTNDSGKTYICASVTSDALSAGSGGPTGTGSGIVDNHVTWNYVGTAFQKYPFRRNIRGLETVAPPSNGYWTQGEFCPNLDSSHPVVSSGAGVSLGTMRVTTGIGNTDGTDWVRCYAKVAITGGASSPTQGGTAAPDANLSEQYTVTYGAGITAATINSPLHPQVNQFLYVTVVNNSGGAVTTTWDTTGAGGSLGYSLAYAWVDPANGTQRSILFNYDTSTGKWKEIWRQLVAFSDLSGTITTAEIADNAVTLAKLATISNYTILGNASGSAAVPAALTPGGSSSIRRVSENFTLVTPTNGATVNPTTSTSPIYGIRCNASVSAITIDIPDDRSYDSEYLELRIFNNSGGTLTITWTTSGTGSYKFAGGITPTAPANGKRRTIAFRYDSNSGKYLEVWRSPGDDALDVLQASQLPNPTASTLGGVKSLASASHQFLTQIGTDGSVSQAQPATTDLSDVTNWTLASGVTCSWNTNTTITAYYRKIGKNLSMRVHIALSGAPNNATLTVSPPSGISVDLTKMPIAGLGDVVGTFRTSASYGSAGLIDLESASDGLFYCRVYEVPSSTTFHTAIYMDLVAQTVPFTWGNGNSLDLFIDNVPTTT